MTNGPNPGDQSAPVPPPWIQNDYWAPDRAQVLADPSRWGPGPNASPAAAPPAPPAANTYDRTQVRDSILGGVRTTGDLANLVNGNQTGFAQGVKILPGKGDKIQLPDGAVIDALRGAGVGGQGGTWTGVGDMGANGQITPYAGGGGAGTPGAAGASGGSPFQDSIRQQLLQILQNSQKPVDASDPQIAAEMNAQKVLVDRQSQQQRGAAAERAAFQGLLNGGQSSGSFDTTLQGINQDAGQQLMGFQAQLFSRAIQQKQSQLQQALSLAVQSGDAESARAIQMQIAQMENALRQQQLGQQQSQFNDSYGLQKAMYEQNQNNYALGGVI